MGAAKKPSREELRQTTFYELTANEHALMNSLESLLLNQQSAEGADEADAAIEQRLVDQLIEELNGAQELRDAKLDRMLYAYRGLLSEHAALEDESKRLKLRAARKLKKAEWIEQNIQTWMETAELEEVETRSGANRIKLGFAGKEPVEILDESRISELPADCRKEIPATWQAVKDAIYKALKAGLRTGDGEEGKNPFEGIARLGNKTKRLTFS
jgi:hypothetical protein